MVAWLRVALRAAAFPACAGAVIGLWNAGQQVGANRYLEQGLWHTALWLASRDAMAGALLGLGGGVLLAFALTRRLPSEDSAALVERRLALAMILTAALAVTFLLLARQAPHLLELPARLVCGLALGLFWAGTSAYLLARTTEETKPEDSVEGVWTILVWLCYLVGLSYVWERLDPGLLMVYLVTGGLLATLLVYVALGRPVRFLARVAGARLRRPAALGWLHRISLAGIGVGVVVWGSALVVAQQARGSVARRPNLLIIALDTTRADRVSMLSKPSSGWDLTQNLRERLAPHGTYFTRAHSQAPWTMPSFGAIHTGLYPEEHGAQTSDASLLPHRLTLAEILRDCGYQTMAVISGHFVSSAVGMLQGFERSDETQVQKLNPDAVTSAEVTRRAVGFLESRREEPFFLFVHYFDPHYIYQEHKEFPFTQDKMNLPRRLNVLYPADGYFTPQEFAQLKALYAEEIAYTDLHLEPLLDYLDKHQLWDNTCVVFVSDHGDEFLEHGGLEHGHSVFEELVQVPLFVASPFEQTPASKNEVVETRWLFGTALDLLGIPRRPSYAATPNLFSPPPEGERFARSSISGYQSCLTETRYKVVVGRPKQEHRLPNAKTDVQGGQAPTRREGQTLLFDLLKDPGETRDLSKKLPEVTRRLRAKLEGMNRELAQREEKNAAMPRLSEEQKRRLKALGYL